MPPTVLIVEDCENTATPLEIALGAIDGIQILLLSNAQDALNLLNGGGATHIAALVTDLHLPIMDGFELIENVRSNKRYAGLPILVISGDSDPDTPDRLRRLGADAYFAKPYSPSQIRDRLERLLRGE